MKYDVTFVDENSAKFHPSNLENNILLSPSITMCYRMYCIIHSDTNVYSNKNENRINMKWKERENNLYQGL